MAVTIGSLGPTVYLPSAIYSLGQGAVAPVVVLSGTALGASAGTASVLVGLIGVGQIVGAVPAGALIARIGERPAMVWSSALVVPALLGCVFATSVWMLGFAVAAVGLVGAVWGVARQTYVTEVVPYALRARALSTLGGASRIGAFVGPFVGAAAMTVLGTDGGYWVHAVAAAVAATVLVLLPGLPVDRTAGTGTVPARVGTLAVIRDNLAVLRTLGLGVLLVGALRAARQTVVPLWGAHLDLHPATLSLIFGLSGAVDMLLFYPSGKVMDRWGRRVVAVPSMFLLGLAHALLPLATTVVGLAGVAMLMGLGNGLSSGLVMTLGADVSPVSGRAQFLGAWRLCADLGTGAGPLLIAAVLTVGSLTVAVLSMAGVGAAAVAVLYRWIPRPPTAG
ncbi:putative MFS family arabinose efflux permease [Micromonospora pisi]|uniref:Putative MFS family arabinose efflux permease n=1 Tax=Micromonospora pisi TaxID=589240 RepID=A0A495JCA2_9ACTN|nr:putative MFS family arabinose efflux permease [Micromonospora pisi]